MVRPLALRDSVVGKSFWHLESAVRTKAQRLDAQPVRWTSPMGDVDIVAPRGMSSSIGAATTLTPAHERATASGFRPTPRLTLAPTGSSSTADTPPPPPLHVALTQSQGWVRAPLAGGDAASPSGVSQYAPSWSSSSVGTPSELGDYNWQRAAKRRDTSATWRPERVSPVARDMKAVATALNVNRDEALVSPAFACDARMTSWACFGENVDHVAHLRRSVALASIGSGVAVGCAPVRGDLVVHADTHEAVLVLGMRRSGKTTLALRAALEAPSVLTVGAADVCMLRPTPEGIEGVGLPLPHVLNVGSVATTPQLRDLLVSGGGGALSLDRSVVDVGLLQGNPAALYHNDASVVIDVSPLLRPPLSARVTAIVFLAWLPPPASGALSRPMPLQRIRSVAEQHVALVPTQFRNVLSTASIANAFMDWCNAGVTVHEISGGTDYPAACRLIHSTLGL